MPRHNRLRPLRLCQNSLENSSQRRGVGPMTLENTARRILSRRECSGEPSPGWGVALLGFQTELINDLVSLSCKKTGNVFQGRKFSPAFKRFQCFLKPEQGGSPLGLAGVMDICAVCEELFQPPSKPAHYRSTGSRRFLLVPKQRLLSWCV